jgi:ribosomal protein S18 acetylase RimI-like enzyme
MTLTIRADADAAAPCEPKGPLQGLARPCAVSDAEQLAALMLDSYRGTVDDEGETIDDARRVVAALIAGEFGTADWDASVVFEREGRVVSAALVTRDRVAPPPLVAGEAFLAFSMTAASEKRRGLGRAGVMRVVEILRRRGEPRLHLVVTRANVPAVTLYLALGFEPLPLPAGEGRGLDAAECGQQGA